jgi:predicted nucleotidyltransferase
MSKPKPKGMSKAKASAKPTSKRSSGSTHKSMPLTQLFKNLKTALESLGLQWQIIGAQALLAHGVPRATQDVDVSVFIGSTTIEQILNELKKSGIVAREKVSEQLAFQQRVLLLVHTDSGTPIDLVLAGVGLEEEFLSRSSLKQLENVQIPVAHVNDLIVMKMLAQREKDIEDVRLLLRSGVREIDFELIRVQLRMIGQWLDDSAMPDLFERLLMAENQ